MTDTFPIVPGQVRILWLALPVLTLAVAGIAVAMYSLSASRTARFEVSPDGLRLRGDFYGRLIPARSLRLDQARVIDLRNEPELKPVLRTLGTSISGYRAGWFRLRDGERALLYVTDPARVVYLPTADGYSVMLSGRGSGGVHRELAATRTGGVNAAESRK
jgi:Bacterial PH domain